MFIRWLWVVLLLGVISCSFLVWAMYGSGSFVQFNFLGFSWPTCDFQLNLDLLSLCCWSMLFFCGVAALLFNSHYHNRSSVGDFLSFLLVVFLGVMCSLVLSGGLVVTLITWEYLGVVSVGLILFRMSGSSLRAAVITLASSRFGDVGLFFVIGWVHWYFSFDYNVFSLMLLSVVVTKSACYPLISWLLEAMRAPTPVSSLVHSSTLVAAGVWFLYRYSDYFSPGGVVVLFSLGIITVVLTGLFALVHTDLKKLVALSTCNNISWCIIFFLYCGLDLALFQLVVHGVCKVLLFMSVGDVMSSSGGSQSAKNIFSSRYLGSHRVVMLCVLVLSLCGLPFLGVFFSKHHFFSSLCEYGAVGDVFVVFFGLFLSFAYSFRLLFLLLSGLGLIGSARAKDFILVANLCLFGTCVAYILCGVLVDDVESSFLWCVVVLATQILGGGLGCLLYASSGGFGVPSGVGSLWYSDSAVSRVYVSFLSWADKAWYTVFRWEGWLISGVIEMLRSGNNWGGFFFSISLLIMGLLTVLCFWLVLL